MEPIELKKNRAKFLAGFQKSTLPATFPNRFSLSDEAVFLGKIKGEKFWVFRKKKGRFALLPTVLQGEFTRLNGKEVLICRFRRTGFSTVFFAVWCLVLGLAGFSFLPILWDFALLSLFLCGMGVFYLFYHPKKEKEALLQFLFKIAG